MAIRFRLILVVTTFMLMAHEARSECVSGLGSSDALAIRQAPQDNSDIIGRIPSNSCRIAVDFATCSERWCRISYDGKFGWAEVRHIDLSSSHAKNSFNYFVLRAIYSVTALRRNRGFDLHRGTYTQDLSYSKPDEIQVRRWQWDKTQQKFTYPGGQGLCMCVAGVAETLIEALNQYYKDGGDKRPFDQLVARHWQAEATRDQLRLHLWEYDGLYSKGAAHALERFNVGVQTSVDQLSPGDLFKLNRNTSTGGGHSAFFVAYIDKNGDALERYSAFVKGVLYFSCQGTNGLDLGGKPSVGLGFRREWFDGNCPNEEVKRAGHCQMFGPSTLFKPNVGYMLHPRMWTEEIGSNWKREQANHRQQVARSLYSLRSGKPGANYEAFEATASVDERRLFSEELNRVLERDINPEAMGHFVDD